MWKKCLYILLEIRVVVNNVDGMVNGGGCVVIGCTLYVARGCLLCCYYSRIGWCCLRAYVWWLVTVRVLCSYIYFNLI